MNLNSVFAPSAEVATELLAVFAVDAAPRNAAKPEVRLLTADDAPAQAVQAVLDGGEFKAESCETLLLHNPAGLKAKRLLLRRPRQSRQAEPARGPQRGGHGGPLCQGARPARGRARGAGCRRSRSEADRSGSGRGRRPGRLRLRHLPLRPQRPQRPDRPGRSVPGLGSGSRLRPALREGVIVGESQNFARALVNEPGNRLTPDDPGSACCRDVPRVRHPVRGPQHREDARA